jgi:hypothetical protein
VATGQAAIIELTRARASPFRFIVEGTSAAWGGDAPLEYEALLDDFPDLERDDVLAALAFAADRERKLSAASG